MARARRLVKKLGHGGFLRRATTVARGLLHPTLPSSLRGPCAVVGHRGAARLEAENTIASFQRAIGLGADAIETDVSATADGRFALWHDADPDEKVAVARQLGGEKLAYRPDAPPPGSAWRRPVRNLSADDLREHYGYLRVESAGSRLPERAGVAFFEDLLDWVQETPELSHLFLDLKLAEGQQSAAVALVASLRAAGKDLERIRVHLLSPVGEIVAALVRETARERDFGLRASADFELPGAAEIGPRTGAPEVSLGCGGRLWSGYRYDVGRCLKARDEGRVEWVTAWTISDLPRLETLVRAGVDGILTDDAALLRRLVGQHPVAEPRP